MCFLRPLKSPCGMFHGLHGMFVPGLVVFFPVMCGGNTVCMGGEFVELGSPLMRVQKRLRTPTKPTTALGPGSRCAVRQL